MCGDGAQIIAKSLLPVVSVPVGVSDISFIEESPPTKTAHQNEEAIIIRGNVLTMAAGKFSPAEAFAVRGDTIVAVGTLAEVQDAVGSEVATKDYTDKFILPGFIDPHIHLLMTALVSAPKHVVDFSYPNCKTRQGALDLVKQTVQTQPKNKWISGYGYDPSLVAEHPDLTLDLLDGVAGDEYPVIVINQSGHVAYMNSAAFAAASIGLSPGEDGYPAENANFRKDETGKLTGIILEEAVTEMAPFLPKLAPDEVVSGARATLATWASRGITTVFDCGIGHLDGLPDLALIRRATAPAPSASPLPRFRGAIAIQAIEHLLPILDTLRPPPWRLDHVTVYGIKFWLDGSTQGFTAALHTPYLPHADVGSGPARNRGILNYRRGAALDAPADDARLLALLRPFVRAGWQIVCHANGARALDQALRVYARVFAAEPSAPRHMHRLEHVTADVSAGQLRRAAQLGLGVSHLLAHVRKWGHAFAAWVLGPERAARLDPVADCVDAGVTYSFHSDSPISTADPLQYVETAVGRVMDENREVLGPEQRIGLEEAVRGVTYNPARQIGALDEVGSIEWGKKADFVVLDRDPRTVEGGRVRKEVKVLETWIGGMVAFKSEE